jgi:hypothetical protein
VTILHRRHHRASRRKMPPVINHPHHPPLIQPLHQRRAQTLRRQHLRQQRQITPAGPWPVMDMAIYNSSQGLIGDVIDAATDDAQNLWVATPESLYVLQPGKAAFRRLTAADGLHVQIFTDPFGRQAVSHITALACGCANEGLSGTGDTKMKSPHQHPEVLCPQCRL